MPISYRRLVPARDASTSRSRRQAQAIYVAGLYRLLCNNVWSIETTERKLPKPSGRFPLTTAAMRSSRSGIVNTSRTRREVLYLKARPSSLVGCAQC